MKRIDTLYKFCHFFAKHTLETIYDIHYEGKLPSPPYVLLPKHQRFLDLPLEGMLIYRENKQLANVIMRDLPFKTFLQALGVILIVRPKDKKEKTERREINNQAIEQAINCLENKEPLSIHPEGTRHYKEMGPIKIKPNSIISQILMEQKRIGAMPFVSCGIEYQKRNIYIRTPEKPFYTDSAKELEERITKEIKQLSNL